MSNLWLISVLIRKIKVVRLAAAGCLHTAVALELSAGQARAAELTRTRGGPTTPSPPPAEWVVRANPSSRAATNLKSPSVAFSIRRPTRTPTRMCRLLRATDSDGTCRPPASTRWHHGTHRGPAWPDMAVTSDKMFPATSRRPGPSRGAPRNIRVPKLSHGRATGPGRSST
jgi:hypothetical protein